ncbi:MAG: phospho-N-acetylmuramoyl-pentapeptide-transferase [Spirochaetaceae bacterium]
MLYQLGQMLTPVFGPFRLLTSYMFLITAGVTIAFFLTLFLLPKSVRLLPRDRGKEYAVQGSVGKGKPTGSGLAFISVFVVVSVLVVPFNMQQFSVIALTYVAMLTGFFDDRSERAWSEYVKAVLDLGIALVAAFVLIGSRSRIWLPFFAGEFTVPVVPFMILAVGILWLSINSTNCTDGVDGLSSTLAILGLLSIGIFLYFVAGHSEISEYLLIPHYPDAANWSVMTFVLVGCLSGYLWYNAYPSEIMMGDAGSRAVGFFLGVTVLIARNPFLILIVSTVILVNGGTGLVKVTLLRFFNIRILHSVRFPLHDHFRNMKEWSNTQVLVRFSLIQILLIIVLFGMFLKVR